MKPLEFNTKNRPVLLTIRHGKRVGPAAVFTENLSSWRLFTACSKDEVHESEKRSQMLHCFVNFASLCDFLDLSLPHHYMDVTELLCSIFLASRTWNAKLAPKIPRKLSGLPDLPGLPVPAVLPNMNIFAITF